MGFFQRYSRVPRPNGCPKCGYSLRGLLIHRCPECGTYVGGIAAEPDTAGPAGEESEGAVAVAIGDRIVAGIRGLTIVGFGIYLAWSMWGCHRTGTWKLPGPRGTPIPAWLGWLLGLLALSGIAALVYAQARVCFSGLRFTAGRRDGAERGRFRS